MGFASKYLSSQLLVDSLITNTVSDDLKLIVIIPVYMEPNIIDCLDKLNKTIEINGRIEVIILINSSEKDSLSILEYNRKTFSEITSWITNKFKNNIDFYVYNIESIANKNAGVGLARKIAMDEAVRRFAIINNKNGVIVSLDADTLCLPNYFNSIISAFGDSKVKGASIYFEHPIGGNEFNSTIYKSSALYELYLRYYVNALRFIGHPHAYHCIGSAFAVRVSEYVAQGGMNKKQAGEDFYFLQKIISQGNFIDITDTILYPSSRLSERTPFGTGRTITNISNSNDIIDYKTYSIRAFIPLKNLFMKVDSYYKSDISIDCFPAFFENYLNNIGFIESVNEINRNCASLEVFRDKFYRYFSIFRVLKYLNFVSDNVYSKESVIDESLNLLSYLNININSNDVFCLLFKYREIDRNSHRCDN